MNPICAVLVGHLIGDWIFQTDWQAKNKPHSWKANQQHMLSYHLTLGFFCMFAISGWALACVMGVSWITHSIIDRRRIVKRLMKLTQSYDFSQQMWGVLVVDQALHLSILLLMVGVI